jgi:murein DD-endopeptidase MepM/ murein hydrolase activator NlpD
MQGSTTELLKAARAKYDVVSDRIRSGLRGRSHHVVVIAALAGIASVGSVAADIDNGPTEVTAVAATTTVKREAAAERADRSARTTAKTQLTAPKAAPKAAPRVAPKAVQPAQSKAKAGTSVPKSKAKAAAPVKVRPAWGSPMPGAQVTSCFGQRWGVMHAGVDLGEPAGTPIRAVGAGTVFSTGWAYSGYGISVVVDHHDGYFTHYAHMSRDAVRIGQQVKAGDLLGYEGSTGDSTGPHLHFEVHKGMWNQIEPSAWLKARGVPINC